MNLKDYYSAAFFRFFVNTTFVVLSSIIPFSLLSQEDLAKTVQVTKAYDPIISDAEKIEFPVSFNDTLLNIRGNYQYAITPQNISTSVVMRPMPAAKINENAYKDPEWLYARLGVGYPLQFSGDLYLHNLNPADISYGLFYNHRSVWAKINNPNGDNIPIDEMNHQAGIFFKKNWERITFNIDGGFSGHNLLFYGYNTTAAKRAAHFTSKDSIAQTYTSIYINAGINSHDTKDSKFRYRFNLLFDAFGDNGRKKFDRGRMFSMNENRFAADILLGYALGEGKHLLSVKGDGDFYMRSLKYNTAYDAYFANPLLIYSSLYNELYGISGAGEDIADARYIFNVTPTYSFSSSKIDINLGVKYTVYKKTSNMKTKVYPVANVRFKLANEFAPYAAINGEVKMNDYKSIVSENPYITPGMNMAMKATDYSYIISAGAKGNIENILAYNVYGQYSLIKDFYFFVNSEQTLPAASPDGELLALRNNFDAVYDDVQQLKAGADLKLLTGPVETTLYGSYCIYELDRQKAAFHRPTLVAGLNVDVKATKFLNFNLNTHAISKTPYMESAALDKIYYNDAYINLAAGAEYIFSRELSILLNAGNLLNSKNGIWYGYRLLGPSILGGVTFKF
jgi:hypothetical protein